MDSYGCYRQTKEDAAEIAAELKENGTIVFPWSYDQIRCHIVLISQQFAKLGIMPFGGNPVDRIYVAIYGIGCGHLSKSIGPVETYLEEKLGLKGQDAKNFAEFYQWIIQEYRGTH